MVRLEDSCRVSYRTNDEHSSGRQPGAMAVPRSHAFFASCEQQENPALRGQPIIVVQTMTDSAVAIAASYAAKAFGIKTGTLMRDARQLCPAVVPVQANHRLYTEYHERILKAVDTCLPVEKVCSIDEMACKLMGTERQVPAARELAVKVKRALREQVGECLTCSIGIAPKSSDWPPRMRLPLRRSTGGGRPFVQRAGPLRRSRSLAWWDRAPGGGVRALRSSHPNRASDVPHISSRSADYTQYLDQ